MDSILIKPHHFIDIIKLYGSGIDRFVPDEKMGHDFYKVANEIIDNPSVGLKLTIGGDDICKPCKNNSYLFLCYLIIFFIPDFKDIFFIILNYRA